jgi:hypothetical protein
METLGGRQFLEILMETPGTNNTQNKSRMETPGILI